MNAGYHASWRFALAALAAGSATVLVSYFDGFASLVVAWSSTLVYQTLFLVPLLSLGFLRLRWPEIRGLAPHPSAMGLLYALPFVCLWLVAAAAQVELIAQVAAVGMLQAVFLTVLGWEVCRRLLFPLLLLWMMVPFGDLLMARLMELTTSLTIAGLRLAGMPAVADGNLLVAGGARYSIIQDCSGLDFLVSNLLVSLVFANLIYRSTGRKLLYVVASVPVAILANNLRTTTVILFTTGGADLASDHEAYGWFLFCLAMLGQMAVGVRYRDDRVNARPGPVPAEQAESAAVRPFQVAACGIVLLAAAAPAWVHFGLEPDAVPSPVRLCLPPAVLPAGGSPAPAGAWRPVFPAAASRVQGVLTVAARPVDLFIAYYWRQGPGNELINWENRFHDGEYWRYMEGGWSTVELGGAPLRVATERLAGAAGERRLVWYWYWVNGQFSSSAGMAKLRQARAVLLGGDQRAAVIALSTEEPAMGGESGIAAADTLQEALERLPEVASLLREVARGEFPPGHACP